ncbi:MarR family winged helix-turn-helix transcriptional regulator [Paracoccus mutanolyticus]|nr:MarR family transcriptional regulator [Paracoccus mutanolyticus]
MTLFEEIISLTRSIRAAFETRVRRLDLTYARARLLTAIGRSPGASQAELAAEMGIETPTLKRLLDALEAQGLAERRPLEGDARKHAVFLTDTSRIEPCCASCRGRGQPDRRRGPRDLAATRRVLATMTRNADRLRQP